MSKSFDVTGFNQMTSKNLKLPMSQIVLDRKASYVDLNTGKGFMWIFLIKWLNLLERYFSSKILKVFLGAGATSDWTLFDNSNQRKVVRRPSKVVMFDSTMFD